MAKEGQRILLTPRNPHCGHRNDCDGTRMLSSQYQPRYPAIQAKASSISEAVSDNTNEVSNLRHCLGRTADCQQLHCFQESPNAQALDI